MRLNFKEKTICVHELPLKRTQEGGGSDLTRRLKIFMQNVFKETSGAAERIKIGKFLKTD